MTGFLGVLLLLYSGGFCVLFIAGLVFGFSFADDYRKSGNPKHRRDALESWALCLVAFVWPVVVVGFLGYYAFRGAWAVIVGVKK